MYCILPVLGYREVKKMQRKRKKQTGNQGLRAHLIREIIHISLQTRENMPRILLPMVMMIAVSMISASAFAESTMELKASSENIKALDSVIITGKITDVSNFKPVKLSVMAPDGAIVYTPLVTIDGNGEFKKVLHPTLPSFKSGTYIVTASHEDTEVTAQAEFTVTSQEIPRNPASQPIQEKPVKRVIPAITSSITMAADAINGSDTITVTGNTSFRGTDITLIVNSPIGNVITIAQVAPDIDGDFELEVNVGGPLWKEDGLYTITANQGSSSEHRTSIQVEVKDGLVVPEFGVIASLILAVSVISIIIASTKSRLAILPRY